MSARDWIKNIAQGDRDAFQKLYTDYASALNGVILRIVHDESTAEEVLQDVFVKIWNNASRYDPDIAAPYTWMHTITRRIALNAIDKSHYRRRKMIQSPDDSVYNNKALKVETNTDHLDLKGILAQLPNDLQSVIELSYFNGYTQKEIAEKLSIPIGTVKSRTRIALRELKKFYKETAFSFLLWTIMNI